MQVRARERDSTYILHGGIDEMPLQPQRGSWSGSESDSIDKDIVHTHTERHTYTYRRRTDRGTLLYKSQIIESLFNLQADSAAVAATSSPFLMCVCGHKGNQSNNNNYNNSSSNNKI